MEPFRYIPALFVALLLCSCNSKHTSLPAVPTIAAPVVKAGETTSSIRAYGAAKNVSLKAGFPLRPGDHRDSIHVDNNRSFFIEDGSYPATVAYYNPATGYHATYTLNVKIENGKVIQIDFPDGSYLEAPHITPAGLDTDSRAIIKEMAKFTTFKLMLKINATPSPPSV